MKAGRDPKTIAEARAQKRGQVFASTCRAVTVRERAIFEEDYCVRARWLKPHR
jgi:hypothetical protein